MPAAPFMPSWWNGSKAKILAGVYPPGGHLDSVRDLAGGSGSTPTPCSGRWPSWKAEGLVRTERTSGRYVTEDTDLIEQLRAPAARDIAADFLEKMRSIGYTPEQAAALLRAGKQRR